MTRYEPVKAVDCQGTKAPPRWLHSRGHDTEGVEPSMPDAAYCEIQLGGPRANSRRGVALVDYADAEAIGACSWFMHSNGYAVRSIQVGGKRLFVFMHRFLLDLTPGDGHQVDHINGDKLDNRRENLRVCTNAQNNQNLHQRGPYRGASWHAQRNRWRAYATLDGKQRHLGYFAAREDAAAAASAFRRNHMPFSSDARLGRP